MNPLSSVNGSLGNEPALDGGWYAAPPAALWTDFAQRYHAAYDLNPPRIASLAYDATTLAQAETMCAAADEAGVNLCTAYRLHNDPDTERRVMRSDCAASLRSSGVLR